MNKKLILIAIAALFTVNVWGQLNTPNGAIGTTTNPTTGNVGIGTTSPTSNLHISASSNPEFLLRSESTGKRGLWLKVNDDQQIVAISSGYHEGGAYPMVFRVNGYEKLRISKDGNIGIGTTEPASKLEIKATGEGASVLRLSTERPWEFIQMYEGGNTGLGLRSTVPSKSFFILSQGGNQIARFSALDDPKQARIFFLKDGGRVGIGTTRPSYTLSVKGKIGCGEIIVEDVSKWSDFVFEPDYNLMTLNDLETFIKANKHLPEIPTTAEVEKNGISVGEMNAKLLQKVEELTLYVIELKKENIELNKKVDALIQK